MYCVLFLNTQSIYPTNCHGRVFSVEHVEKQVDFTGIFFETKCSNDGLIRQNFNGTGLGTGTDLMPKTKYRHTCS